MLWRLCATVVLCFLLSPQQVAAAGDEARPLKEAFAASKSPQNPPSLAFKDGAGQDHVLNEFKGRYVLLNVWATWCAPCIHELPSLDSLSAWGKGKNLAVIALAEDSQGAAIVPSFFRRHQIKNLTVALDPDSLAQTKWSLHGLPTTILLDPKGLEIGRVEGPVDWAQKDNLAFLERLIK